MKKLLILLVAVFLTGCYGSRPPLVTEVKTSDGTKTKTETTESALIAQAGFSNAAKVKEVNECTVGMTEETINKITSTAGGQTEFWRAMATCYMMEGI